MLIGGILFTDYVFADLTKRSHGSVFLNLPANRLEKVAGKWILTALIFPVFALVLYQIFALFGNWFVESSLGLQLVALPLFDAFIWKWVLVYISLQSVFFLGAMSLGRFASVKTVLVLTVIFTISSFLLSGSLKLLVSDLPLHISFWGVGFSDMLPSSFVASIANLREVEASLAKATLPIFLILPAPLLLLVSFFKYTEKEVT